MRVSRAKRVFMWTATVLFSLFGLLLVAAGPDLEARLAGVASLLFFGVGGFLYLRMIRARPAGTPDLRTGRTDLLGISESGVELPVATPFPQALAFGFMLALGVGLTAVGVVSGSLVPLVLGIINTLLFVYITSAFLRRRRTSQRVVLTATGLVYEHPLASLGLRWQDVEGLSLYTQNDVLHLAVEAPREAVVQRTGSRVMLRLNRTISGAAITIPAMTLRVDADALLDALAGYADDPSPLRDPERERHALQARLARATSGAPDSVGAGVSSSHEHHL